MKIFCIDIGNTHTHFALVEELHEAINPARMVTVRDSEQGFDHAGFREGLQKAEAVMFATVVPLAGKVLKTYLAKTFPSLEVRELTVDTLPGTPIHYPHPREIGEDRLANAVAAYQLHALPAVVIDMGTAVTFDIITAENGYEGGIIAPGVQIMTEYLHQQTALLPRLQEPLKVDQIIGTSTREAMTIGCVVGFRGMIQALLQEIAETLRQRQNLQATLIATGGTGFLLEKQGGTNLFPSSDVDTTFSWTFHEDPGLTLRGLFIACRHSLL